MFLEVNEARDSKIHLRIPTGEEQTPLITTSAAAVLDLGLTRINPAGVG